MAFFTLENSGSSDTETGMLVVGLASLQDSFADSDPSVVEHSAACLVEVDDPMSLVSEAAPDTMPHSRFAGSIAAAEYLRNQSE